MYSILRNHKAYQTHPSTYHLQAKEFHFFLISPLNMFLEMWHLSDIELAMSTCVVG